MAGKSRFATVLGHKKPRFAFKGQKALSGGENGAIIVLIAVGMVVLLGLTAMAIDIGLVYLRIGEVQRAVDAAAYSAGQMLPVSVNSSNAQNAIKDSAIRYASLNGYDRLTRNDIVLEGVVAGYYTKMQIAANDSVPSVFASAFGIDTFSFARKAAVKLSPLQAASGVAPLGITEDELEDRIIRNDLSHVVLKYGVGDGTQSSFGAIDLDGQGGGASDYRLWISTGYAGQICVGDILLEEMGNMTGPTYQGFSGRFDACTHYDAQSGGTGCTAEHYDPSCPRIIKVIVYSKEERGTVTVRGFAAFLLESQTNDGYITGTFLRLVTNGTTSGEDLTNDNFFGLSGIMLTE